MKPITRAVSIALVGLLAAVLSACGAGPVDGEPLHVLELGPQFSVEISTDWDVQPLSPGKYSQCEYEVGEVYSPDASMEILQASVECEGDIDGGNGTPFTFGSVSQLEQADDLETVKTPLGLLTIGTIDYYECTNECNFWTPELGILELADPPNGERPTIVIVDPRDEAGRDEIIAVAKAMRVS